LHHCFAAAQVSVDQAALPAEKALTQQVAPQGPALPADLAKHLQQEHRQKTFASKSEILLSGSLRPRTQLYSLPEIICAAAGAFQQPTRLPSADTSVTRALSYFVLLLLLLLG
jgi:hypothetical protein